MIKVSKRDGSVVDFNLDKIRIAVLKAVSSSRVGITIPEEFYEWVEQDIRSKEIKQEVITLIKIDEIQKIVEKWLKEFNEEVYECYHEYRKKRDTERYKGSERKLFMDDLASIKETDILRENANMSGQTPSGQMMKIASENAKEYALRFLIDPRHAKLHEEGKIHIHDNDFYVTKTMTCLQYNLKELFNGGFKTEHTFIREPQRIEAYADLAAIVFQTNQNEFHGGQSIPAFDFFMAPGVLKSFKINMAEVMVSFLTTMKERQMPFPVSEFINSLSSINVTPEEVDRLHDILCNGMEVDKEVLESLIGLAYSRTERQTYQAMESFLYNMETMHSRGGNQVVFSSINYGTDTSPEGRMVMKCLLDATEKGGGNGETFIFPIQIFKLKDGVTISDEDIRNLRSVPTHTKVAPNFDLFVKACQVSSRRLFPNFLNLDSTFNQHEKWRAEDPNKWMYEVATMG